MYSAYYPIGTSGHRVSASIGFAPHQSYATPVYGISNGYSQPSLPPVPSQYIQPSMIMDGRYLHPVNVCATTINADGSSASGGVSSVLEYDSAEMAAFLCWCAFGMLGQNRNPTRQFESSIVAILNATRLPKSTVVIGLAYIDQRFAAGLTPEKLITEAEIFQIVVVALVLANKFNDDNTFTNKSWCGASRMDLSHINALERAWLSAVGWDLNVVNFTQNIETLEDCWMSWRLKSASPSLVHNHSDNYYGYASYVPSSSEYGSARISSAYAPGYSSSPCESPRVYTPDWVQAPHHQHRAHAPSQSIWAYPQANYYQTLPPTSGLVPPRFCQPLLQLLGHILERNLVEEVIESRQVHSLLRFGLKDPLVS